MVRLGSPLHDQLAIHPLLWAVAATPATAGSRQRPGLLRWSCGAGGCCEAFLRDLAAPLPGGVAVLWVYSRRDGLVDWRACVEPAADTVEVAATHCGMVAHAPTAWAVATAIRQTRRLAAAGGAQPPSPRRTAGRRKPPERFRGT